MGTFWVGSLVAIDFSPWPALPGWAEIRQWAYNTQMPLYKDGDTSLSLVLTGSLGLIDGVTAIARSGYLPSVQLWQQHGVEPHCPGMDTGVMQQRRAQWGQPR